MNREAAWRLILRALQLFLLGAASTGVVVGRGDLVLNASVGLGFTAAVHLLERRLGVSVAPWLVVWLAAAAVLHVGGMLFGLYGVPSRWDDLTHAASGSIVAAAAVVWVGIWERRVGALTVPVAFGVALVLMVVMAAGVAWEVIEFAVSRGVQLHLVDTLSDLLYNLAGGVVALAVGRPYLRAVVDDLERGLDRRDD